MVILGGRFAVIPYVIVHRRGKVAKVRVWFDESEGSYADRRSEMDDVRNLRGEQVP